MDLLNLMKNKIKNIYLSFSERMLFSTNHKYITILFYVVLSSLFFLFVFILPYFFPHIVFYAKHKYIYNSISFVIFVFILYRLLYYMRGLQYSLLSFVCFFVNIFFVNLTLGIIINILNGLPQNPITVSTLSFEIGIRYSFFVVIGLICFCLYVYNRKYNNERIQQLFDKVSFPYLYEETRILLSTWEDSFFGDLFETLLNWIAYSKIKFIFVFFTHFFFYYIIPFTQAIFLFNFAFFLGDLRYNLYLMPFSLLSLIFKHIWHYFSYFVNQNAYDIRNRLDVTYDGELISNDDINFGHIKASQLQFSFKDSAFGSPTLLEFYKQYFLLLGAAHVKLTSYKLFTAYLPYLLLFIRFSSWCSICFSFFGNVFLLTPPFIFSRLLPSLIKRGYAQESFLVKKAHFKDLEKATHGAFKCNHPFSTDVDKINQEGKVPFYHQNTHGAGQKNNPSLVLSSTEDLKGNPMEQRAVYPDKEIFIPRSWAKAKPIQGSNKFYERQDVKENDLRNRELKKYQSTQESISPNMSKPCSTSRCNTPLDDLG
jgi:hypothetical protein